MCYGRSYAVSEDPLNGSLHVSDVHKRMHMEKIISLEFIKCAHDRRAESSICTRYSCEQREKLNRIVHVVKMLYKTAVNPSPREILMQTDNPD